MMDRGILVTQDYPAIAGLAGAAEETPAHYMDPEIEMVPCSHSGIARHEL